MICEELFILLRLGLELSTVEKEDISLFSCLNEEEWRGLMNTAQEQGVLGIALDGLSQLGTIDNLNNTHSPWFFELIGGILARENLNNHQIQVIGDLSKIWAKNDVKMLILKGQSNGLYYPNPLHRDCGDIDCYLLGEYEKGNDIIKDIGIVVDEDWEKHSKFGYKGETVENHQFFVQTLDKEWSKAINNDLFQILQEKVIEWVDGSEIFLPDAQFNALFLTYHAMDHFLMGNLKLKQIIDWAMFINKEKGIINWDKLNQTCHKYNLHNFLGIMNSIALTCLGVELVYGSIIETDIKVRKRFIQAVFYDKDFIWDNSAGRWHGRFHFFNHVLNNRWKYNIAGRSTIKTLWFYISSYKERNH